MAEFIFVSQPVGICRANLRVRGESGGSMQAANWASLFSRVWMRKLHLPLEYPRSEAVASNTPSERDRNATTDESNANIGTPMLIVCIICYEPRPFYSVVHDGTA
ncbi:hypothetical protein KOW79_009741 [Hemibagrus wyckioides]|uniref:Uncharacterized protein n=1 Tax=Hemibagrus wyckioides TaxID=337641 RepID=A0A9D3NSL0_9TELE|nr:hypothetical protein KOW79_009741 [Hemibagrus wyckioides]